MKQATTSRGTERAADYDRLERLLSELLDGIDPSHEIVGQGRRYERLPVGDDLDGLVEAWLIAWPPRTGLGMHDHRGSEAVVAVVRSSLRERYLDDTGISERWLQPGQTTRLAADHVHEVVNMGNDETLSIHVYSPPLADADFRSTSAIEFVIVAQDPSPNTERS